MQAGRSTDLLRIETADGLKYDMPFKSLAVAFALRGVDARDLLLARLPNHGDIEGQLPAELASQYTLRVTPIFNFNDGSSQSNSNLCRPEPALKIDADGHFLFQHVVEGNCLLFVVRREPFAPGEQIDPLQLQSILPVVVRSGETTKVDIKRQATALVQGRVVATDEDAKLEGLTIGIAQSVVGARPGPLTYPIAQAVCDANGEFAIRLPTGDYEFNLASQKDWLLDKPKKVQIGQGAASVVADEIKLTRRRIAQVVVKGRSRAVEWLCVA